MLVKENGRLKSGFPFLLSLLEIAMDETENSGWNNRFMVIPKTLIFVFNGDQVLLIKGGAKKKWWSGFYNGVGGHVEYGEDISKAARRELKEETSLEVGEIILCAVAMIDDSESTGSVVFMFKTEYTTGELVQTDEGELEWLRVKDLEQYPVLEDLKILIPRFKEMKSAMQPWMLSYRMNKNEELRLNI
jgi:8-oxo-dGTP diphosphatase